MNSAVLGAQHEALAAVAHKLRLPRTHIKRFVGSLRRAEVDWDDNTRSEFLAAIELEADRLAQLVERSGTLADLWRGNELEFTIDAEGPGIPAEDRERIFEPFFRKRTARQSNVPGHGLGLAICQSIEAEG